MNSYLCYPALLEERRGYKCNDEEIDTMRLSEKKDELFAK